jgi:hypothetical protein
MRKLQLLIIVLVLLVALVSVVPVFAHGAPPCNDSGEPGNSDYAKHHIKFLATSGSLGSGGHIPGSHQGFSTCNPSGK